MMGLYYLMFSCRMFEFAFFTSLVELFEDRLHAVYGLLTYNDVADTRMITRKQFIMI